MGVDRGYLKFKASSVGLIGCLALLGAAATFPSAARAALAQDAYFKASNTEASDGVASSIAISGDTMVVGAFGEDSNAIGVNGNGANESAPASGAAYVFVRSGQTWVQQAYLKASNTEQGDLFGRSVAIDGDTIVVGAPTEDSSATGVNGSQGEGANASGAAYAFTRSGTTWSQQAYLKASNTEANDAFGGSVAIDGDTVVVGASSEDSNATGVNGNQLNNSSDGSGAAYVFFRTGSTWSQQAYVKASNTELSNPPPNPQPGDAFGGSVGISGDTIVVGADGEDSNALGVNLNQTDNSFGASGAAYVFTRAVTTWSQQAYLKASNTEPIDLFGDSVAISGNTIVVGASLEDSSAMGVDGGQMNQGAGQDSGAAYVFFYNGATWSQQAYLKASNTGANDSFGENVAISGNTIVAGALAEDSATTGVNGDDADNSLLNTGAAYSFTRSGAMWSPGDYLKASNTGDGDEFGSAVAVDGFTLALGAPGEDSNATGVNGNQASNGALDSGAAYVFGPDGDGDAVADGGDNCPSLANPGQQNHDGDQDGDLCDPDDDNDTLADGADACPAGVVGPGDDPDGDGCKNPEDADDENDTVLDVSDNCPSVANTGQENHDGDSEGDACDADDDNDGIADGSDACAAGATGSGSDADNDGCKNSEDTDDDGDGVADGSDNCPTVANPGQGDADGDGIGTACDSSDQPPVVCKPAAGAAAKGCAPNPDPACEAAKAKLEKAKKKLKQAEKSGKAAKIKAAKKKVKKAKEAVAAAC